MISQRCAMSLGSLTPTGGGFESLEIFVICKHFNEGQSQFIERALGTQLPTPIDEDQRRLAASIVSLIA